MFLFWTVRVPRRLGLIPLSRDGGSSPHYFGALVPAGHTSVCLSSCVSLADFVWVVRRVGWCLSLRRLGWAPEL